MNIINKLTIENLKKNKKRTAVTIIGIILSTALICAVAGMVMSFKKTMLNLAIANDGDFHMEYENVPQSELKYIENNVGIKNYFYSKDVGYAKLENSKNDYKPYLKVVAMTDETLNKTGLKLEQGRMPENENEVVISDAIESNGGVKHKIGEKISLQVGKRVDANGKELTQETSYNEKDENGKEIEEKIIDTTSKDYTIVGIIKRPSNFLEPYDAPGYTVITKINSNELNKENEKYNVYVRYKEAKDWDTVNKNILKTIQDDIGEEINTTKNKTLLEYEGAINENQMKALYWLAGIIIGIIVVSSVFVIKNGFSISVTEKTKEFGMLSSIGTTSKQIRKSVLFEGFIIGLIGIPVGIALGVVAIVVLIQVLNLILEDLFVEAGMKFVYSIPLSVVGLSVVFGGITIFLSSLIPAIKASRISPIVAIRSNNDIKIKNKKLKTSKLIKKLFGIGGVIASKNLKRSKKKYRTTVVSLVVSIAIFVSLSSFMQYGMETSKMMFKEMDYSICVSDGDEELYKDIAKNGLVKKYSYYKATTGEIDINKYGTEYAKRTITIPEEMLDEESKNNENNNVFNTPIVLVNRDYFKEYIKGLGLDEKDSDKIAILEDKAVEYTKEKGQILQHWLNVKEGDTIAGNIVNFDDETDKSKTFEIKITKRVENALRGWEMMYAEGGAIFVSEDYYQKEKLEYAKPLGMYIKTDEPNELESQLTDLKQANEKYDEVSFENIHNEMQQVERVMLVIAIFLYGFIIVITLIGVTNIFNTITTNMILRSKEFAMLKSIGMTKKEFNKMIRLESIMYTTKSLIIGIPLGLLGSYGIYGSTKGVLDMGYMFPIVPIIIAVAFVFILVTITMRYSMKQINKQNIVETIRNDNI